MTLRAFGLLKPTGSCAVSCIVPATCLLFPALVSKEAGGWVGCERPHEERTACDEDLETQPGMSWLFGIMALFYIIKDDIPWICRVIMVSANAAQQHPPPYDLYRCHLAIL
ncbi:hypothetical protein A0H81_12113 [Grifola frondosa]|uniref:Uncharacterized protein n=1 Tax=Grifola frondosa TaxID=5627 RepID=A0A1C7LSW0_GRIFR|nr:hypothetical protein A0H81_12113 [Grifola frondosa]